MKIYLSPSMQRANLYAADGTNEQEQCSRIAEACETALLRCGFEVKRAPKGQAAEENIRQSNEWGADIHLPIHTNAGGGRGAVVFVQELDARRKKFAEGVYRAIDAISLYKSVYGVRERPGLYEIRASRALCLYTECEFHDNAELARWIIDNTEQLGEAICRGLCEASGTAYVERGEAGMERYGSIGDVPEGYRPELQRLIESGALRGRADGALDLSEDMLRCMIVNMRYTDKIAEK